MLLMKAQKLDSSRLSKTEPILALVYFKKILVYHALEMSCFSSYYH